MCVCARAKAGAVAMTMPGRYAHADTLEQRLAVAHTIGDGCGEIFA